MVPEKKRKQCSYIEVMIVGDYCIVDAGAHIFSIFICFRECYSKMLSANVDMNFCPCEAEPREIMLRRKQTLHLHNINAAAIEYLNRLC